MNEDNHIRQQFQSKFSDFKSPVPADGWDRLEKSLNAAAAAKMMRRRWYIGSAAAVIVLLIGSLLFLQQPADINQTVVSEIAPSQETLPQKEAQLQIAEQKTDTPPQEQRTSITLAQKKKEETPQEERYKKSTATSDVLASWFRKQKTVVREHKQIDIRENHQAAQIITDRKETDQKEAEKLIEEFSRTDENEMLFAGGTTPEKESKLMMSFGGKGGLSSFQKTVNSPMTLRSASVDKSDNMSEFSSQAGGKQAFTGLSSTNNIAEMFHAQPVSFGFTISKPLVENLSIETGLVYTYLFSEARNTNINSSAEETQHFHYVGIPLNVNYTLFSINKLQVYTSLGGIIEKDVFGQRKYKAQTINETTGEIGEEWKSEKIKQEKPQFSVNAGLGASYPITNNFNLYGKVGGSYHFETNNTYKTIYSDKKIMLDLNVGLRYEF